MNDLLRHRRLSLLLIRLNHRATHLRRTRRLATHVLHLAILWRRGPRWAVWCTIRIISGATSRHILHIAVLLLLRRAVVSLSFLLRSGEVSSCCGADGRLVLSLRSGRHGWLPTGRAGSTVAGGSGGVAVLLLLAEHEEHDTENDSAKDGETADDTTYDGADVGLGAVVLGDGRCCGGDGAASGLTALCGVGGGGAWVKGNDGGDD